MARRGCAAAPARAGDGVPPAADLQRDGAAALATHRVILLFMVGENCAYCDRVQNEFLIPMSRNESYRERVIMRQVPGPRQGAVPLRGARRRARKPLGASCPPSPRAREAEPRSLWGEQGSRTWKVRRHPANPEYARQRGKIGPRSRSRLGFSG